VTKEGKLAGKTAFVTGASSGIGEACARLLAEDGAAVLMMGRRPDALERARARVLGSVPGAQVEVHNGDATEEADVRAGLAKAYSIAGRLDVIVPAVGGAENYAPMLMDSTQDFMSVFKRNLLSAFLPIRDGAPLMGPDGGSIVCISTRVQTQSAS
jgi:NAD(P)-dependent dehydrogenase (short-subunit alcohol dehydrogenase family)